MKEITGKTAGEFRKNLIDEYSFPSNRDCFKFIIQRDKLNSGNNNILKVDLTSCDREGELLGVRAWDEERKEYFFINLGG